MITIMIISADGENVHRIHLPECVGADYECGECRYLSDKKYWYCPCCGKKMENHEE